MLKYSFWIICSAFFFALLAGFNKAAAAEYSVMEIVAWRAFFGLAAMAVLGARSHVSMATRRPWEHLIRSVTGTVNICCAAYVAWALPLGTAQTLAYTSPLWFAAGLVAVTFIRKERPDWGMAAAVAAGFLGVLIILRPDTSGIGLIPGLLGILTGISGAFATMMIRRLAMEGEPGERIIFYFNLSSFLIPAAVTLCTTGFHPMTPLGLAYFFGIGLSGTVAQLALTEGWGKGAPMLNAVLEFSSIIFAVIIGTAFFGDVPDAFTYLGIAVVTGAGISASLLRMKKDRS